jgi:uncharacterized protein (DUF2236 family)
MAEALPDVGFEALLRGAAAQAAGPAEGLFGPQSASWSIDREAAIFLGAGRALLLQLAHPWVAAAIAEHSPVLDDPIGRFHRTFRVMFTLVFGTTDQALAAARRLRARHAAVEGAMPLAAGPFAAGSRYFANEPAALQWVHATLVESALVAHDLALPPLCGAEKERFYAESRLMAALLGVPPERLPADHAGFCAYNATMQESQTLTVTPQARAIARALISGAKPHLRPPQWFRAITAATLPPRLRIAFGLADDADERRRAEAALARIRRLYPFLPARLRYVGPYQEALARLEGRRPDFFTRRLSHLWIGAPAMGPERF